MTLLHIHLYFTGLLLWIIQLSDVLANATELLHPSNSTESDLMFGIGIARNRRKRYISQRDMSALLDYHNQVRSKVFPPAANMEYMVWDERLAKSAESWANQCKWDHGPTQLMRYIGQNLSIHSGRYRSIVDLVKAWYDERQHYSFPYPRECNPSCPNKCSGSVCSHYTQVLHVMIVNANREDQIYGELIFHQLLLKVFIVMQNIVFGRRQENGFFGKIQIRKIKKPQMVWASSNRIGCAINTCTNINVWGSTWRKAVYLVCNYSIKGNWIGEAPYKLGRPCSACPPSYGGVCNNNMCYSGVKSNKLSWF